MAKIHIDEDLCIGCGLCSDTCPDIFELTDDGKARVKEDAADDIDCAQDAADICPTEAIIIED